MTIDVILALVMLGWLAATVGAIVSDRRRDARTIEAFGRPIGVIRMPGESTAALRKRVLRAMSDQ